MAAVVAVLVLALAALSCTNDDGVAPEQGTPPVLTNPNLRVLTPEAVAIAGQVRANDRATIFLVEYGPTDSYGQRTRNISLPPDTTAREVRDTVTGLTPGSLVHFRVLASSPAGTATGPDMAITMPDYLVEFSIPWSVGTEWTYGYSSRSRNRTGEVTNITGVHTWRLISADVSVMPRTYAFMAHKVDDYFVSKINGQTGGFIDTTYTVIADVPFGASVSSDSITFQWPVTIGGVPPVQRIPRFVDKGTTSAQLKGVYGGAVNYDILYGQGSGLVSYSTSLIVMSGTFMVTLGLTSVVKP
jgi:hypothetical protein